MNAERLLELYDRISEAPDAVSRLRRFVLDLAVRGKLVEQDPEDEPASELLERIAAEKKRLVNAGQIRKVKPSPALNEDDIPFDLPHGWAWTQIADLGLVSPRNEAPDDQPASFVPMPMIASQYGVTNRHEPRAWKEIKKGYTHFAEGDVALAKITPCFENGKSTVFRNLAGGIGAGTTELHVIRPLIVSADYILLFVKTPHFIETGISKMTGTAGQKRVPKAYFTHSPFPLPPLAEQHRIVAKVDELMALCDRLEETHNTREATRYRLTNASLTRLTAPDTDEPTFQSHARFALDTLPALTTRPDQIKTLRRTILDLAVRGKLVEQNPRDTPASALLSKIREQRNELLAGEYPNTAEARTQIKKLAKQQLSSQLPTLPSGWEWATLQQCSLLVVDCKNKTAPYSSSGINLVRTTNVRNGRLNNTDQKYVTEATYKAWSVRCLPEPGDILITREAPMGEVCLVPAGETVCLGQRMMLARLVPETIDPNFMLYSLRDPRLMERVQDKPLGMTVQHLRVGGVESLLVPVPPLAEQHRIVAKVDEFMVLCDRLESNLETIDDKRGRLLDCLITEMSTSAAEEPELV
ncbi:restriction endonuclease subunit S [Spectribacter hydrogenooxidans]|uniref:Restriction endonuclease subunit S n=1 Tax=Spectribacter hydrogenoxidans TaxID=3075608 RepID=A0ABU3BWI6_9GAMM|nr:restriction endonuclease subunit S [Salinisphaera sp. W335]MDT0633637.1 restriction endonuclease subunit S [Salinisphaera sp. W335]